MSRTLFALGALIASSTALAEDAPPTAAELAARGLAQVEPTVALDAPTVILSGGTVMTANGEVFEQGYVILEDGKIKAVGAGAPEAIDGAVLVDTTGKFVTPGVIDTHSHLGVYPSPSARAHSDGNEATRPTTPGVWAEHSFWPQDPGLQRAVAGGVTTLQVLPGSANLVGGRGVVLHNLPHRGSRAMRFPGAPETVKMACGENPKRVYGEKGGPSTRMGNLRGQRTVFIEAREYKEDWDKYEAKLAKWQTWQDEEAAGVKHKKKDKAPEKPEAPKQDLDKDTLAAVMAGEVLPQIHCYRADDMLSMLQVAEEFGWSVRSFHHAVEAYKIRDVLAEKDVSVSTWADWWGFKMEAYDAVQENAAMVHDAGARAIIHSDSGIGIQRLNQEAAKAYHAGKRMGLELTDDDALRWITANPAWALGIDDQVGTLEPGKRADVVLWDAHPLSVYASAEKVFVDGALVWDAQQENPPWADFEVGQTIDVPAKGEGVEQ
ncbi:MAG: amidohydrolase [Deltaproteobacteria bacterium]|nr:MAG: amidohydrolase [Deltaproteobacteria bacterium]